MGEPFTEITRIVGDVVVDEPQLFGLTAEMQRVELLRFVRSRELNCEDVAGAECRGGRRLNATGHRRDLWLDVECQRLGFGLARDGASRRRDLRCRGRSGGRDAQSHDIDAGQSVEELDVEASRFRPGDTEVRAANAAETADRRGDQVANVGIGFRSVQNETARHAGELERHRSKRSIDDRQIVNRVSLRQRGSGRRLLHELNGFDTSIDRRGLDSRNIECQIFDFGLAGLRLIGLTDGARGRCGTDRDGQTGDILPRQRTDEFNLEPVGFVARDLNVVGSDVGQLADDLRELRPQIQVTLVPVKEQRLRVVTVLEGQLANCSVEEIEVVNRVGSRGRSRCCRHFDTAIDRDR